MKSRKGILIWILVVLGVLFAAIQFVPVDRSNPATQTQVPATPQARDVLTRACYDCHSNETVWPWYSYVAPVSWLVAKDVRDGRSKLNFSTWNVLSAEEQSEAFQESWEQVQEGEMPLWFYLPLHPSAKLSAADRAVLQAWSSSAGTSSTTGTGGQAGTATDTGSGASSGTGTDMGTSGAGGTSVPSGGDRTLGIGGAGESRANGDVDNDGDND
jgi:Haem-binding domain